MIQWVYCSSELAGPTAIAPSATGRSWRYDFPSISDADDTVSDAVLL